MRKIKYWLFSAIFWLLVVTFFKGMFWAGMVPLWHFPDEQAHFAQLQNIAETNHDYSSEKSTSREIYQSELLLGTFRDEQGNNRFTFHPEYNLPYSDGFFGFEEDKINSLTVADRQKMEIAEATSYPPLYYFAGALIYRIIYPANLFVRVFTVRIFSTLLTVGTVWLAYKIGKLVFNNEFYGLCLGLFVSFQPMFTFVGSGVNSDALFNFFFSAFIYASLLVFKKKDFKSLSFLILSLSLGILTKQQMMIAIFLSGVPLFLVLKKIVKKSFVKGYKERRIFLDVLLILFLIVGVGLALNRGEVYRIFGFIQAGQDETLRQLPLLSHLLWTAKHTIAEVLPWYWGVFKWLGVVLPPWVNRVQMRILAIAVVSLLIYLAAIIRNKKIEKKDWQIGFLIFTALAYFMAVTLWNWQFRIAYGFPFGVQGRYFLPTVVAHMALIIVGVKALMPRQFKKWTILLLSLWWIVLSFIALETVINAYYQTQPWQTFWWQVSQYKPFWYKGHWWLFWILSYCLSLIIFYIFFFRVFTRARNDA